MERPGNCSFQIPRRDKKTFDFYSTFGSWFSNPDIESVRSPEKRWGMPVQDSASRTALIGSTLCQTTRSFNQNCAKMPAIGDPVSNNKLAAETWLHQMELQNQSEQHKTNIHVDAFHFGGAPQMPFRVEASISLTNLLIHLISGVSVHCLRSRLKYSDDFTRGQRKPLTHCWSRCGKGGALAIAPGECPAWIPSLSSR